MGIVIQDKYRGKGYSYYALLELEKNDYNVIIPKFPVREEITKDVLNERVKLTILTDTELKSVKALINKKYSVYSDSNHLVPFNLLEQYCKEIDLLSILMKDKTKINF